MASIEYRSGNWSTYWRKGGRNGTKERCTFGSEKFAIRAKEIAEAHRHDITKAEVDAIILGDKAAQKKKRSELPTVREWADTWLGSRTRIGPGQRLRYRSQLDRIILPRIGDLHLDEVGGTDIVEVLKHLADDLGYKPTTLTRYFTLMHSMFKYAVAEKKLEDNPADRTDFVRDLIAHDDAGDDGDEHVYLTRADYDKIYEHMAPAGRPAIEVLAGTGCRWSEATALPVSAVVAKPRGVRVHRAWKQDDSRRWYLGATKGRQRRIVTVGVRCWAVVEPLTTGPDGKRKAPDALLLTAPKGGRVSHSNFNTRLWEPAVDAAMRCDRHPPETAADGGPAKDDGGKWRRGAVSTCDCEGRLKRRPTLHDLRHSHVAWLIAAGQPIAAISRRLGHRTTEITEITYAGILEEVHEAMAAAIDGTFA